VLRIHPELHPGNHFLGDLRHDTMFYTELAYRQCFVAFNLAPSSASRSCR
jgi:hypothetical protein